MLNFSTTALALIISHHSYFLMSSMNTSCLKWKSFFREWLFFVAAKERPTVPTLRDLLWLAKKAIDKKDCNEKQDELQKITVLLFMLIQL